MMRLAFLIGATLLLALPSARSEDLLVTLSDRTVDITSNFTGSAITVFGAIRRDAATVARVSDYDVVVTVTGPTADSVTRRKERVGGIWINRASQVFEDVPTAYSVLSNRPIEEIAHPAALNRLGIGMESLVVGELPDPRSSEEAGPPELPQLDAFQTAFLRLKTQSRAYLSDPQAVSVIDDQLFRARAPFPADVPLGNFTVRVLLFSGGVLLAEEDVGILVRKTGFEQILFSASQTRPLLYGFGAVILALFTGWLGGVVFRRS